MQNMSHFGTAALRRLPHQNATEQSGPLSKAAIFRQSLIALTKAAQESRLLSSETLYRTGSCFAYGTDRKIAIY
jgi:hypothetical protein